MAQYSGAASEGQAGLRERRVVFSKSDAELPQDPGHRKIEADGQAGCEGEGNPEIHPAA